MTDKLLILGASSDIARAIARKYALEGWQLILAGRDIESISMDAADLNVRYGIKSEVVEFDALAFETHKRFWESLGAKPLAVICVFGYLGDQKVSERNWEEAKRVLDTNFCGAVSIVNIVANDFEERGRGVIIGIASVAADRGRMSNYIYGSAKAGLATYLSGLRNRLHDSGIGVITVKPGFVYTRMTERMTLPRLLTATCDEVARDVFRAQETGKSVVYSRWFWRFVMLVLIHVPERIFEKLRL